MKIDFTQEYQTLIQSLSGVPMEQAPDQTSLNDTWQTKEQKKRDNDITNLLSHYVVFFENKVNFIEQYRPRIVEILIFSLSLTMVIIFMLTIVAFSKPISTIEGLVSIVTAYISFSALIIGLIKTVTEYVFPKDDEKYITQIVSSIQQNDLDNKKVNIDALNDAEKKKLPKSHQIIKIKHSFNKKHKIRN